MICWCATLITQPFKGNEQAANTKEAAAWEKGMHVRQLQFCTHALSAQVLAKQLHLDDFMIFTFACNRALTDTWDLLLHKDIKRFKENRKK